MGIRLYTVPKNERANIFVLCWSINNERISIKIGGHVLEETLNRIMQKLLTSPKICAITTVPFEI